MPVVLGSAIMSVIGVVNGVTNLNGYISVFIWLLLAILFATAKLTSIFIPFDPSAQPLAAYNVMYTYLVFHTTIYATFLCLGWGLLHFGLKRSPGALGKWYAMFSMIIGILLWVVLHCTMVLYDLMNFPYGIPVSFGLPLCAFACYYFAMKYIIQHDVGVLDIAKRSLQSQETTESLIIDSFRNIFSTTDRLFWYCIVCGIFVSLTVIGQFFQYIWATSPDYKEIYAAFCTAGVLGVYVIVVWWFYPLQICDIVVICEPKEDIETIGALKCPSMMTNESKSSSDDSDDDKSSDDCDKSSDDCDDDKSGGGHDSDRATTGSSSDEITTKKSSSSDNESTTLLITKKKKKTDNKKKAHSKKTQEVTKKYPKKNK